MKLRESSQVITLSWSNILWIAGVHILGLTGAVRTFNLEALFVFFAMTYLTLMFGVTFGFHRLLTHRSFVVPRWLENAAAFCGTLACQGGPISWVGTHRLHHAFSDRDGDPHNARAGFMFSHAAWVFRRRRDLDVYDEFRHYAPDLDRRRFFRWLEFKMIHIQVVIGLVLLVFGGLTGGGTWDTRHALSFVVWGVFLRLAATYHITWLVNSAAHKWGSNANGLRDLPKNNWWVGILAFGEGWHNNHHAQPRSARHGWHPWQFDQTWLLIRGLERVGVATQVIRPNLKRGAGRIGLASDVVEAF